MAAVATRAMGRRAAASAVTADGVTLPGDPRELEGHPVGADLRRLRARLRARPLGYAVGTPFRMGPGYFPLVLGGVAGVLGVAIVAKGVGAGEDEPIGPVPWRASSLILAALSSSAPPSAASASCPRCSCTALLAALAAAGTVRRRGARHRRRPDRRSAS